MSRHTAMPRTSVKARRLQRESPRPSGNLQRFNKVFESQVPLGIQIIKKAPIEGQYVTQFYGLPRPDEDP
jgi:hypothetical protein